MNLTGLLVSPPPLGLHLVQTDASTACDLLTVITKGAPGAAVRVVRGSKSRTASAFFDEIAAALQFPYYFGENWNALDEVINDLSWVRGDAYLLLFTSGELLLRDAPEKELAILVEVLSEAHAAYRAANVPFHAVFQCATPEATDDLSSRLTRAKGAPDVLEAR